ncbi:ferrichrome ABC transporter permease [Enterococcus saccharolyticus subsp. saccharolyticus ATCC 43076]|uniref:Ferrichrome ABC transporter permease n=1 Tax=Enterococcus saccharolyticus subsp. saccharolyticus ATCC 43076 TaxID=1139996 RepID=S0J8P6_9ENTE|nr:ferrichrome ABC transporter permease [Enterococcus saccharolyticus subsp. saccharolyticus ATCC 43076]EOT81087.1 ferrichrome ABC transporter permease [Enterococcus saccharolyticus subsp. saccharolyticus ATCC 43076]OJG86784.1 ferrichrome ABC transporter permease [Enterococcus saccharolyticus]
MLLVVLVLLVSFALTHGKLALSWSEIWEIVNGGGTSAKRLLLFNFRLPRIVLAILAGALLTAVIIFVFAYKKRVGIIPVRLVLTGVVVSTGISALTLLLITKIDSENYRFVTMWHAGSIWGSNWFFVLALLPWMLVLIPWLLFKHRELDILQFGGAAAISLGVNIQRERIKLIIAAVALTGAAVSVTGGIGFLGLITPHITRRLGFKKHWQLLPVAAAIGSVLLLISDTIGRLSPGSGEIPAGTVVAIIGAPYFLYLLLKESTR